MALPPGSFPTFREPAEPFEGFAWKKRTRALQSGVFQRRYVRIESGGADGAAQLTYSKKQADVKARGIVALRDLRRIFPTDVSDLGKSKEARTLGGHALSLTTEKRTYHLLFEDAASHDAALLALWARAPQEACTLHPLLKSRPGVAAATRPRGGSNGVAAPVEPVFAPLVSASLAAGGPASPAAAARPASGSSSSAFESSGPPSALPQVAALASAMPAAFSTTSSAYSGATLAAAAEIKFNLDDDGDDFDFGGSEAAARAAAAAAAAAAPSKRWLPSIFRKPAGSAALPADIELRPATTQTRGRGGRVSTPRGGRGSAQRVGRGDAPSLPPPRQAQQQAQQQAQRGRGRGRGRGGVGSGRGGGGGGGAELQQRLLDGESEEDDSEDSESDSEDDSSEDEKGAAISCCALV